MDRIRALQDKGQSIWFDFIERSMLLSGGLQTLVDEGVVGVTSNPSIFQSAISGSDAYVSDIRKLAASDDGPKAIYESLAIADIQTAADILRPVYDNSGGQDGFVSLEVAPDLAYDTEATIAEAKRLHQRVDRPNLMIKVPATVEGLPAIRDLIRSGININVTLIFSADRYEEVMEAYILGLEDRASSGQPVDGIASVASFFVSRVDVNVDAQLEQMAADDPANAAKYRSLQGKTAIANAKIAYRRFEEKFDGPRWARLAEAGASVQRPLWASTGTKNPAYSDLLYVEILIGPHTVNTMPPSTLDAFRDHGEARLTVNQDVDLAVQQIERVEDLGISLQAVTKQLEEEGVAKFAESFVELLETIDLRSQELNAVS